MSYLRNGNWTVIEQGRGGWIDRGIYEWGGASQPPVEAEALRVQLYSDGNSDLVSIHIRGRGGLSRYNDDRSTVTKATLIQYLPGGGYVDTVAPVITLNGGPTIDVALGGTYVDPGATAQDDVDGDLTSSIEVGGDVVDTERAGTYVVTYDVSDSAGNPAQRVTRSVNVMGDGAIPVITLTGANPQTITLGRRIHRTWCVD